MSDFIVYMHQNKANGKRYIGITHYIDNPNRRWINGKGYCRNEHFIRAIEKYGWNGFDHIILASGLSKADACEFERMAIKVYNTQDKRFGYNITDGGEFFHHSEKSKALMSERRKGKGLHSFSDEHKCKMRENHKGGTDKKKVRCVETGKIYESINAAAHDVKKSKKMISNCCRGVDHYNTAGGFHWEFA